MTRWVPFVAGLLVGVAVGGVGGFVLAYVLPDHCLYDCQSETIIMYNSTVCFSPNESVQAECLKNANVTRNEDRCNYAWC